MSYLKNCILIFIKSDITKFDYFPVFSFPYPLFIFLNLQLRYLLQSHRQFELRGNNYLFENLQTRIKDQIISSSNRKLGIVPMDIAPSPLFVR